MCAFAGAMDYLSRPGYFDDLWSDLLAEISVDLESCEAYKDCAPSQPLFNEFVGSHFSGATCVFTDGSVDPSLGVVGSDTASLLSAELYGKQRCSHLERRIFYSFLLDSLSQWN